MLYLRHYDFRQCAGIYISDLDLGNKRRILSTADIPLSVVGLEDGEFEDMYFKAFEDWTQTFNEPLLMNGGRQLVATIFCTRHLVMYRWEGGPIGVVVLDLQTGEKHYFTDIDPWSGSAWRIDERTIVYPLGRNEWRLVDVESMEYRVVGWGYIYGRQTYDFQTAVRISGGRTQHGERIATLFAYEMGNWDDIDERTELLTVTNGRIEVRALTENFVLLVIFDLSDAYKRTFVLVPLAYFF